jgi:peptidoglycan/LPS O-acetylase OafA/YrhL
MDFIQITSGILLYETPSFSVVIFALSALLLIIGVTIMIRQHAFRISFLENKPLNWIEKTHPYIPSPRIIVTSALCIVALMMVGLQTMNNTFPFNDPYQGLNLASFFLLGGAIGTLAQLKWKHATEYMCAILGGTALAFILLIVRFSNTEDSIVKSIMLYALLVPTVLLTTIMIGKQHRRAILLTMVLSFAFWILIYMGQYLQ